MAILRSMDGKFYNVPDAQLEKSLIPADEVKSQLNAATTAVQSRRPNGAIDAPTTYPEGSGDSELTAHGYCWRNCWSRNCWRNCWRNSCR